MSKASKRPGPDAAAVEQDIATLEAMDDAAIDTSDCPEVLDWRHAEVGRFYRPVKHSVTIRLDADVLAWFKSQDGRYQTRINQVLRDYMTSHHQ